VTGPVPGAEALPDADPGADPEADPPLAELLADDADPAEEPDPAADGEEAALPPELAALPPELHPDSATAIAAAMASTALPVPRIRVTRSVVSMAPWLFVLADAAVRIFPSAAGRGNAARRATLAGV
jgi:hypothetical protein